MKPKKNQIHQVFSGDRKAHPQLKRCDDVVYFGRNLNLAIFQKFGTAEKLCTKTDPEGIPGPNPVKKEDPIESFQFSPLMAAS